MILNRSLKNKIFRLIWAKCHIKLNHAIYIVSQYLSLHSYFELWPNHSFWHDHEHWELGPTVEIKMFYILNKLFNFHVFQI